MNNDVLTIESVNKPIALACLRGVIGSWVYYSSLMTAKQITEWVVPVKAIRESKDLDELLQRNLNDGRKEAIAKYLQKDDSRFFNSIIVGVFDGVPDWLEFDVTKAANYVNVKSDLDTIKESIGILIFNGDEKMFAIDGQHRVAGIKLAYEQSGDSVLGDDQFSVIFIAHIDDSLGKKRTRKLFSDINKNAKPVAGGDKIKIDEQDLSAIVTRRIYAEYNYFKQGRLIALTENANLDKGDLTNFTNLLGLYRVNQIVRKLFRKAPKTYDWDECNVIAFQEIVTKFYDFIFQNISHYKHFFVDNSLSMEVARNNNAYLLFRPVGLFLMARLYVHFQGDLINVLDKLNKISFVMPSSPYNGILWNNGKMEAESKNQILAFDLTLYMLGENVDEDSLLNRYRDMLKNQTASLPDKVS